jgi:hypothetical protein
MPARMAIFTCDFGKAMSLLVYVYVHDPSVPSMLCIRPATQAHIDLTAENVMIASAWRTGGIRRRSSLPYPADSTRLVCISSLALWMRVPSSSRTGGVYQYAGCISRKVGDKI